MHIAPVELNGEHIRLEPLAMKHEAGLIESVLDGELWNQNVTLIPAPEHMESFIKTALTGQEKHNELPFAIIDKSTRKVVGSTRYRNIEDHSLEIGSTFIAQKFQRTYVNRESKFLMLQYAFETLHVGRVDFIIDALNTRSQKALERIGAVQDGMQSQHLIMPDWRKRNALIYSIPSSEWTVIKNSSRFLYKKDLMNSHYNLS